MKYRVELSELMLLDEHGGILFCRTCKMIIGYINEKGYKYLQMVTMCGCGSIGFLKLSKGSPRKALATAATERKTDVVNNVNVCGECGMQLFEMDGDRLDSCTYDAICVCGARCRGNSVFSQRLGETAAYIKKRGITEGIHTGMRYGKTGRTNL